jgi:putative transferase (TIGR04331 family)
MKYNFLISAHQGLWIAGTRRIFITDPYIMHVLERTGQLSSYEDVQIAATPRVTREEFVRDHAFVDAKYHLYLPILAARLNRVHGTTHDLSFWRKSLSLAPLRHITWCFNIFQICETNLAPDQHDCRVLSEDSYYVPHDFNDHRHYFQHTDHGLEQLFSAYVAQLHPNRFETVLDRYDHQASPTQLSPSPSPPTLRQKLSRLHPKRMARRALSHRSPVVGIINSYFSQPYVDELLFKSHGRIRPLSFPPAPRGNVALDHEKRHQLSADDIGFDRFDRFFFRTLQYAMPKSFVEDFSTIIDLHRRHFKRYPRLHHVVSEAFLSDDNTSMALAVLGESGVKHIYNEHNALGHPFLGNNLKYLFPMVDRFVSLGWSDDSVANLTKGASLFPWIDEPSPAKEHDLLFISSLPNVRAPEINAGYGESGAQNVPSYLEMNQMFFSHLKEETIKSMVFRAYPAQWARLALTYDQPHCLREYMQKIKIFDDGSCPARALMKRSRLTVLNYLSTAYLEAMLADVPTVFLWNRNNYYLEERYHNFFDELVVAGICQTDAVCAARFVEKIKGDPEGWWQRPEVRSARDRFLSANIGQPKAMIDFLLALQHSPV